MQQLKIIEDFVKKSHQKIIVVGCKTIREKNGIACSSRNFLLTQQEKSKASKVYSFLKKNKSNIINKNISIQHVKKKSRFPQTHNFKFFSLWKPKE